MKVRVMLARKGGHVVTAPPSTSVATLAHMLKTAGIGALIITSDGGGIEGLVSERDIVQGLVKEGPELLQMHASEIMTKWLKTCTPEDDIRDVMSKMTHSRIRHLPVVEHGKLCGIISIGDVVKNRLEDLELETNVLRDVAVERH